MRCPFCRSGETRVIDSRLSSDGDQVRRRRQCTTCQERFTTYETAELSLPSVVKLNGSREPFNEDKLRSGMLRALEKRPVPRERVEGAVNRIRRQIAATGEREIPSREIGERVIAELREIDQVAYVRFASVYRSFQDVDAFREEIERLENEPPPELKRDQIPLLPNEEAT